MEEWRILGVETESGVLGPAPETPGFIMLSLDGNLILQGVSWSRGIGFLTLPRPHQIPVIRSYVSRLVMNHRTQEHVRAAAAAWIDWHAT